jgi:1-acyl-sn-glycerol-3-phosphate acyltransferase
MSALYTGVRTLVADGSRLAFRVRVVGTEHVPASGAAILAPSHRSMMDIPFLAIVTKRRIRFMGKRSVFEIPVLGSLFSQLGGFPVARDGNDRAAVRASLSMLGGGELLAVYPEGTRQHGGRIQPLQPGAAYLALRSGAPIVPVGIAGSEEILRGRGRRLPSLQRAAIVVGEPLVPPAREGRAVPRASVDALTDRLHGALQDVLDAAYRLRGTPAPPG